MYRIISSLPLPAAGLALGLAATGNLVSSHSSVLAGIFCVLSIIIMVLLIMKVIFTGRTIVEDLQNPAIAGIAATFPMGLTVLSAYICQLSYLAGYWIWAGGVLLQIILICYFTRRFIFNFNVQKVYPSYFVVYVGIAAASITAPLFGALTVGQLLFWCGLIAYFILLPLIGYRLYVIKPFPESLVPTITIFAAPPCLCLVGYLNSFPEKNMMLLLMLGILSLISFSAVILYLPVMMRLKFYPSYSAFTFPLVISAIAAKGIENYLLVKGVVIPALGYLSTLIELLAIIFVVYVFVRYIVFIGKICIVDTTMPKAKGW
ncbi:MAG: TDT family transporter [Peptococcaceae bacterium]|nr:TDT family transporter [Peptococcaceae bacterium]